MLHYIPMKWILEHFSGTSDPTMCILALKQFYRWQFHNCNLPGVIKKILKLFKFHEPPLPSQRLSWKPSNSHKGSHLILCPYSTSIHIIWCLPSTTCTSERSFSSLTYLTEELPAIYNEGRPSEWTGSIIFP